MLDPNRRLLIGAAELLHPLLNQLVFVGGCATGVLITDPAVDSLRPTFDVDTIVQLNSYSEYATLADTLRALGLSEDDTSTVICRWKAGALLIDVMPTDARVLGFTNRWYASAIQTAVWTTIENVRIRLITAPYFLATKLEAFRDRGHFDVSGSHDLEDVITVVDGRPETLDEVRASATDVRSYIASELRELLRSNKFVQALPGFLLPDEVNQARLPLLRQRLEVLTRVDT